MSPHYEPESERTKAEENFKATFGHYPLRVDLPEPTPDAAMDRRVYKLLTGRDDYKPNLKVVPAPVHREEGEG